MTDTPAQTSEVKPENFQERRKFLRLNINVDVQYTVLDDESAGEQTTSKNISAGGICMLTAEKLDTWKKIKLNITLPDDPSAIQAIGNIVWVKPFQIAQAKTQSYYAGVEFIEINDQDQERIKKYVFKLS